MNSCGYVAFLRGINVGGNALVKGPALKQAFVGLGFSQVSTILASGNVIFRTGRANSAGLQEKINEVLKTRLKLTATSIVRTDSEIFELIKSNPWRGKKIRPNVKLQVTFLVSQTESPSKFPRRLPCAEFEVVQVSPGEICSAVDLGTAARTPELMKYLEKQFGKQLTTRTWNTLEKIEKALREAG